MLNPISQRSFSPKHYYYLLDAGDGRGFKDAADLKRIHEFTLRYEDSKLLQMWTCYIISRQQLLQQQVQFEQQQIQQALDSELDSVITKIKTYVKKYGDENGYDYIFGTSETTNSVLFGKVENDLSQLIIDGLNSDYNKKQQP